MLSQDEMRALLTRARTIAVVGLSDNPERTSHQIAGVLQRAGYRIIPVNPHLRAPVLGERPVASLHDITEHVDIVDVFRRPEHLPGIVEDAIAIGAGAVWMQPGTANREAAARAEEAGLGVVEDLCIAVMHRLLIRR